MISVPRQHQHEHGDEHGHGHGHGHGPGQHTHDDVHPGKTAIRSDPQESEETIVLEQKVLAKNDLLADHNRTHMAQHGIVAINLMSSPGAGKTTLLERTVRSTNHRVAVIEGDQETLLDADRIAATGARVVQVNTGAGCHLDAAMLQRALSQLSAEDNTLLLIENVGNLVCPALFDLGEQMKVVIISVTEGDDKPLKYPHIFAAADLVVVNKTDLLPYVDFDMAVCERNARSVNPDVRILALSARTGEGLDTWLSELDRVMPVVA
ncbi:hydrogenase nickel incorporation protein HypB [Hoyosella altamirensis]|uniref:Hydrogenase nickel incorporation protein HypB n=2 Tax=Hoyosella altamirensis TaxID=616997 RepID=A0A839RKV9_9ACTN|nr:hydrogenase nickel incorporation protein HypB [Hoyosella altamirensis]